MNAPSVRAAREGVLVEARVTPSAREDSVSFVGGLLHVRVAKPPDKGKANREVVRVLKPILGSCEIVAGLSSRRKTVLVRNARLEGVMGALSGLSGGRSG
jgi:uncharacterized protein (TIGR00251 family)